MGDSTTKEMEKLKIEECEEKIVEEDSTILDINGTKYCKGPFDPLRVDEISKYTTCSAFDSNNHTDIEEVLRNRKSQPSSNILMNSVESSHSEIKTSAIENFEKLTPPISPMINFVDDNLNTIEKIR